VARPRTREATHIAEILRGVLARRQPAKTASYHEADAAAKAAVPKAMAPRIRVVEVRRKELLIEVDHSVTLHELKMFYGPKILASVRTRQGFEDLERVRYRVGDAPNGR
jgi:hypothetical protein